MSEQQGDVPEEPGGRVGRGRNGEAGDGCELGDRALFEEWFALRERVHGIERRIEAALQAGEPSMSAQELYAAHILGQAGAHAGGGSLGVTELSQRLGLSQSATSRMLARFEHQCEVITRTPSATDRRSLEVRLNQEGRELLERTYAVVAQVLRKADGLS